RLDALALVENGAGIRDAAGNAARLQVVAGSNSIRENLSIDALVPRVSTISAADGLYEPGDVVEIEVRLSEAVTVDTTAGRPQLALSNGALATYESGSGSARLVFRYAVRAGDNDDLDLDVTAIAENGAVIRDAAGNAADVAIRGELNTLAYRSDVRIDSAYPQVTQVSANAGAYKAGDVIEIAVLMSKTVSIDRTQGPDPTLLLSNGAVASFDLARSGQNRLIFKYPVTADDTQTSELKVLDLRAGGTVFKSVVTGALANMALPGENVLLNGLSLADTPVQVDLTAPQVLSVELADTELKAGESTTVTVRLSEAIKALPVQEFTVSYGALDQFKSADGGLTWQARYTPVRDVSDASNVIVLNAAKLSDIAGNLAAGQVRSANYEIDSLLPTVAFASDVVGKATGQVRLTLTFSEPVTGFAVSDLVIEGGTLEPNSLEGPQQGLPEGTYAVLINPNLNSDAPIKVRLREGVVQDAAGNANAASQVFVQPVDTRAAEVVAIESAAGAYRAGVPLELAVRFTEAVKLSDAAGDRPLLMLSNGEYATYVSGSGSDRWVFRYQMQSSHDEVNPLRVLALVEEQNRITDLQGNLVNPRVGGDLGLQTGVSLDKSDPAIASFTVVNGSYRLGQTLWIKAELTESVTMTGPSGAKPQLNLTNGGVATYVSGSGSRSLLFKYVVQSGDSDSADLGVSGVTLNGVTLQDTAGNTFKTLGAINAGNDMAASYAVVVDKTAPQISQLTGVNGYYKAGTKIALQVTFDEVVNVTVPDALRKPMLTLSNGAVASYVGGSGSKTLSFEYIVAQADLNRDDLAVLGLSENGSTIKDAAGNNAWTTVSPAHNLAVNHAVVVDTKAPVAALSTVSAGVVVDPQEPVTLMVSFSEPIDLAGIDLNQVQVVSAPGALLGDGTGELLPNAASAA
ncbi:MAG: Ig-like domain-containing protein, partial [Burkholderiaceae bacterium]